MHIAPSIVVFAALQRILMAIPVVIYLAFTRYAPSNTCHLGVLLYCVCFEYHQSTLAAGESILSMKYLCSEYIT
jgi:hypothetical protein